MISVLGYGYYFYFFFTKPSELQSNFLVAIVRIIADDFLVVTLIGFVYEKLIRRENTDRINAMLQDQLQETLPATIADIFFDRESSLKNVLSEDAVENVLQSCLCVKLKDSDVAENVCRSFLPEIFRHKEFWYDLSHNISIWDLASREDLADRINLQGSLKDYFLIEDHMTYSLVLKRTNFAFVCTRSRDLHDEYVRNERYDSIWRMEGAFNVRSEVPFFEVIHIKLDGCILDQKAEMLNKDTYLVQIIIDL